MLDRARGIARPGLARRAAAPCGEILPDWDLSASGLREVWDAGDLSPLARLEERGRSTPEHRLIGAP